MRRCYITDRQPLGGVEPLLEAIGRDLSAGVAGIAGISLFQTR